jgi:putative ABC transport system permease protein
MIRNHLSHAIRYLAKNKLYTLLNFFGLSIGLACFALIGLWVQSELSYDRFHQKSDRIYRITNKFTDETTVINQAVTCVPLASALMKDIPGIEQAVRIDPIDNVMTLEDKTFFEDKGILTDQAFFSLFVFKVLHGDRKTLLEEPYSIVLSQSLATKYFGDVDPIGKSIRLFRFDPSNNGEEFKVTGVVEDCPYNSQIQYNFIVSFKTWEVYRPDILKTESWFDNSIYTYIALHPNTDPGAVQSKLPALIETYMGKSDEFSYEYSLQALTDVHLRSDLSAEIGPTGSMSYVVIFATVGVLVLLLACINYINMSTAYATERFKEVGIHKVMGAVKRQLVTRYLTESWLLAFVSLVIALGWIEFLRPLFENLTGTKLAGLYNVRTLIFLTVFTSMVGLLAGFYPSLVLSAFKPLNTLRGQQGGMSGTWLRKILVTVQFSITIILVISIIVVQGQMKFIHEKDLGFDKNNLVVFGVHGSLGVRNGYKGFVDELVSSPNVKGVARSNTTIGGGLGNAAAVSEDVNGKMVNTTVYRMHVDHDYLDVYDIKLIAGRNFLFGNASDSTQAFIVNEATIKSYGYRDPVDAVGKPFALDGQQGQIIGVVKDFNFASLQHKVEPVAILLLKGGLSRISIRVTGDVRAGFDEVTTLWKKHFPASVLQYAFYEDTLAGHYQAETRFKQIFLAFSIVSLAIACLGLFALVSYTVERRSKEIGIRKVLGASVSNILSMLSMQFIGLVALSWLVAMPVGYYFMNMWLTGFAYHITLDAFLFIAAGVIVLVTAWATVSLRALSSASANPVKSLRNE